MTQQSITIQGLSPVNEDAQAGRNPLHLIQSKAMQILEGHASLKKSFDEITLLGQFAYSSGDPLQCSELKQVTAKTLCSISKSIANLISFLLLLKLLHLVMFHIWKTLEREEVE